MGVTIQDYTILLNKVFTVLSLLIFLLSFCIPTDCIQPVRYTFSPQTIGLQFFTFKLLYKVQSDLQHCPRLLKLTRLHPEKYIFLDPLMFHTVSLHCITPYESLINYESKRKVMLFNIICNHVYQRLYLSIRNDSKNKINDVLFYCSSFKVLHKHA